DLLAPANMSYLVARCLIEQGVPGVIVNVGSRGAFIGEPDFPAYGAAKAGKSGSPMNAPRDPTLTITPGTPCSIRSPSAPSSLGCCRSVSMKPGATLATEMPCGASATAIDWPKACRPAFAAP